MLLAASPGLETENAFESTSSAEQPHKMVLGNRLLSSSQMEDYASSTSSLQARAKYDKMQLYQLHDAKWITEGANREW